MFCCKKGRMTRWKPNPSHVSSCKADGILTAQLRSRFIPSRLNKEFYKSSSADGTISPMEKQNSIQHVQKMGVVFSVLNVKCWVQSSRFVLPRSLPWAAFSPSTHLSHVFWFLLNTVYTVIMPYLHCRWTIYSYSSNVTPHLIFFFRLQGIYYVNRAFFPLTKHYILF